MQKRVKVCIRIRHSEQENEGIILNEQEKTISVFKKETKNPSNNKGICFTFDQIFGKSINQEKFYSLAVAEVTENVIKGYNGTVLAYGQTGAGKTFTMNGNMNQYTNRGICPRAISHIFQSIQENNENIISLRVSYIEIYNEQLYDLLNYQDTSSNQTKDLVILETKEGESFIRGLVKPVVETEAKAMEYLFQGQTNRTIAEHCLNDSSTRSHCIFTIYLEKKSVETGSIVFSKLNLVDLAGSERMKKTNTSGTMFKEATHINKSLTFLEQVVIALGDKKRDHIPYRQSPLTNILKDSLGGNCLTLLIACIWPDITHDDQTIATLNFATRMMRVKISAIINIVNQKDNNEMNDLIEKYVNEIKLLKEQIAIRDNDSFINREPLTLKEKDSVKENVMDFIHSSENQIKTTDMRKVHEAFLYLRSIIIQMKNPIPKDSIKKEDIEKEENKTENFCLPVINTSKIINKNTTQQLQLTPRQVDLNAKEMKDMVPESSNHVEKISINHKKSDKELYEAFMISESGKKLSEMHETVRNNLKKAKKRIKLSAENINEIKREIDVLTNNLQNDDSNRKEDIFIKLKDEKKKYRVAFEEFNEIKSEVNYMEQRKEQIYKNITKEFEDWIKNSNLSI